MSAAPEITLPVGDASSDMATGSIFFIGNATVLIRYAGFTILTDPTFVHMHEQVPLGYGLHATRLTNPAVEIDDLPPPRSRCSFPLPRRSLRSRGRAETG